jgi:diguanylate cyclase (GGDEF)-like protein
VIFTVVGIAFLRGARRDQRLLITEALAMRLTAKNASFERSLQAGLEMAPTEEASFDVLNQALSIAAPDMPVEMLLADSSRAHFHQVLSTGSGEDNRCRVNSPGECPAIGAGQTRLFEDSASLGTCRFLREHAERAWAICVPVSVAGRDTGVIRAQQRVEIPRPEQLTAALELVARKTGDRIGALRVLSKTQAQADVDPLTRLPNRRNLEQQVRDLEVVDNPFVVAFADLDHFKAINDVHGHETGDRALRLFARILRDSIRPRDLLARYGGEEFIVVLPDCSIPDARVVAERIRSALASALDNATVPAFTVTIGLAEAAPGDELVSVIANADRAMRAAKMHGRDRVLAETDEPAACESADLSPAAVSASN